MDNTSNNIRSSHILTSGLNIEVLMRNQCVSEDHQSGCLFIIITKPKRNNNINVKVSITYVFLCSLS